MSSIQQFLKASYGINFWKFSGNSFRNSSGNYLTAEHPSLVYLVIPLKIPLGDLPQVLPASQFIKTSPGYCFENLSDINPIFFWKISSHFLLQEFKNLSCNILRDKPIILNKHFNKEEKKKYSEQFPLAITLDVPLVFLMISFDNFFRTYSGYFLNT